ncbi:hypothetical protein N7462_007425 [Penicillium macrosclerotiorum]|uniref:uncharacterized protein n=1 Tax=Penicillium macrosclerotiorum TaxID=303699 RepID=UPI002548A3C4|nr:uncharacterized protein N7462_007425 [Penicillium macrosclerotiorum]KAJ5679181.1 hypothetical protein N7462_007425 [Penicillium macrosclerotiorum]
MALRKKLSLGKMPHAHSRGDGPTPRVKDEQANFSRDRCFFDEEQMQFALQATNDHIRRRIARLQASSTRLKRELLLLQRHVKEFNHPLFETWEADILTRLVEIAHAHQSRKMASGVAIGEDTTAERETLSRAYIIAAKRIREGTLQKLGLSDRYHQALQRYDEVAAYRSPNPFQTEVPFARWLLDIQEDRPEKFSFWSQLYPVCYGRSVDQSATIF